MMNNDIPQRPNRPLALGGKQFDTHLRGDLLFALSATDIVAWARDGLG